MTTSSWTRRQVGDNVWFGPSEAPVFEGLVASDVEPEVFPHEDAVGEAMLAELRDVIELHDRPVNVGILGGRGAQALHRKLGELALDGDPEDLIPRIRFWMQDGLAPLPRDNAFSFVRDFERLLGPVFLERVGGFYTFDTESDHLESEAERYARALADAGGLDLFFLGHGPETRAASHLAYIKPGSGAGPADWVGVIPISSEILAHHIAKFKAGGTRADPEDERACRAATSILTLGPAAILNARRIVQSVVDAATAPGKIASYRRIRETELAENEGERLLQLDQNPGLWIRLHPHAKSFILPDLLG